MSFGRQRSLARVGFGILRSVAVDTYAPKNHPLSESFSLGILFPSYPGPQPPEISEHSNTMSINT